MTSHMPNFPHQHHDYRCQFPSNASPFYQELSGRGTRAREQRKQQWMHHHNRWMPVDWPHHWHTRIHALVNRINLWMTLRQRFLFFVLQGTEAPILFVQGELEFHADWEAWLRERENCPFWFFQIYFEKLCRSQSIWTDYEVLVESAKHTCHSWW